MRLPTTCAIVALFALAPNPAAGQEGPWNAFLEVEAGLRATRLRGATEALWGGAVLLRVRPLVSVGGTGWLLMGRSEISGDAPGSDLELTFGYGGAVGALRLVETPSATVAARLLVGAGNAKILVPVVGSEFGADNFGVVEPSLAVSTTVTGWANVQVTAAYRFVYALEDLLQVVSDDLKGPSLTLSLGLRRP